MCLYLCNKLNQNNKDINHDSTMEKMESDHQWIIRYIIYKVAYNFLPQTGLNVFPVTKANINSLQWIHTFYILTKCPSTNSTQYPTTHIWKPGDCTLLCVAARNIDAINVEISTLQVSVVLYVCRTQLWSSLFLQMSWHLTAPSHQQAQCWLHY